MPNNHILTQNLYYNCYYPNPKYLIIGYMDPWGNINSQDVGLPRWCKISFTKSVLGAKNQDPPCTLKLGCMVPNSGYLGPNRRWKEGQGKESLMESLMQNELENWVR